MVEKINSALFFETPQDKKKVFETPALIMFSGENEVERWTNAQPLYFYPFSWLDYLCKEEIREVYIDGCSQELAKKSIALLDKGKVHFEQIDEILINYAKERGHRVTLICNIEDILPGVLDKLSTLDFVKIRINKNQKNLRLLSDIPNEHVLSCIKTYAGEGCDYRDLAIQAKDMGFDLFHVAKRLGNNKNLYHLSDEEKQRILELKELETDKFNILIPNSLEERFAKRFIITPELGNVSTCDFSRYRLVLKGGDTYPCYTEHILEHPWNIKKIIEGFPKDCLDCACIYENDMLHDIESKMRRYKNTRFALEYVEHGK